MMDIPWGIDPKLREEHAGTEVADGVFRFSSNLTNWYLIEGEGGFTMVDAGLPDHTDLLAEGLDALEADLADIEAVILTHADPEHMGMAEPLRVEGIPVLVHDDEVEAANAGGADIPLGVVLHFWRPALLRFGRALMDGGVGSVAPISEVQPFADGQQLDVPGRPEVIHTPGHTDGHCVFWLPDRQVLFAGDALQTMDLLRGTVCEPAPERAMNLNDDRAMESVQKLTTFEAVTLLPGHGRPWEGHLGNILEAEFA